MIGQFYIRQIKIIYRSDIIATPDTIDQLLLENVYAIITNRDSSLGRTSTDS